MEQNEGVAYYIVSETDYNTLSTLLSDIGTYSAPVGDGTYYVLCSWLNAQEIPLMIFEDTKVFSDSAAPSALWP